MKREIRYLVFKLRDLDDINLTHEESHLLLNLAQRVDIARKARGRPPLDCVVVESDWPEYDTTWASIAQRVDGVPRLIARMQQIKDYGKGL